MKDGLDDYLAGRDPLSQAYARAPRPEPPAALERAVLEAARGPQALRSPCLAPLGLAATVLLSIAVLAALVLKPAPPRVVPAPQIVPVRYYREAGPQRPPAEWLEAISALRQAGRVDEAAAELRRFRLAYPRYVMPTDE